jgi:hypothetical protein
MTYLCVVVTVGTILVVYFLIQVRDLLIALVRKNK